MSSLESYETTISSQGMSASTQPSFHSTPHKTNSLTGSKLPAAQERAILGSPESKPDPNFIPNFFVSFDGGPPNIADLSVTGLIADLLNPSSEPVMYSKLIDIFEKIAEFLATSGQKPCQIPLVFKSSPDRGPAVQNQRKYGLIKPDVSVLPPESRSNKFIQECTKPKVITRFPWAVLLAAFEVKPDTEWGERQICQYLHTILEYRPDAINVLGMSCNKSGFRFYYVDACVQIASDVFSWKKDLDKLVHFMYTLHQRYAKDIGRDTTMELVQVEWNGPNSIYATPSWTSVYKENKYQLQPIFQYRGRGRRTWVGVGVVESEEDGVNSTATFRVVKDLWRDNSRRYEEGDLLSRIHQNGYIPGIVRLVAGGSLALTTGDRRTKHRLVMGSSGLRLSACESVLEFLKVIYDAIEAHESAMEQGVLHRDISWYNVLCQPKHYIGEDKVIDRPNIGKVLGDLDSSPLCLLTDFDNAALINDNKNPNEGTERTGTPMFMACELAYPKNAYQHHFKYRQTSITPLQFVLKDDALQNYMNVYGHEKYNKFNDFLSSVLSGDLEEVDPYGDNNFPSHQAHHDIESMFWIIVLFLVKALPAGTGPYPTDEDQTSQEWLTTCIYSRRTQGHNPVPVIKTLKDYDAWYMSLHPAFRPLTGMMSDMAQYLCVQWSKFRDLRFCWWHSHEAFKRLLLKEIVRMSNANNDPMPIRGPRPPLPSKTQAISAAASKSRTPNTTRSSAHTRPSSIQTSSRDERSTGKSESSSKRSRLDSTSSDIIGNAVKKLRATIPLSSFGEPSLVKLCLENIDDDSKWFNEPS